MDFFGMGALEILLVLLVGLIAFGPGKIPELARNIAKAIRTFRRMTTELTAEVTKEFKELETEEQDKKSAKQQVREERSGDPAEKATKPEAGDAEV